MRTNNGHRYTPPRRMAARCPARNPRLFETGDRLNIRGSAPGKLATVALRLHRSHSEAHFALQGRTPTLRAVQSLRNDYRPDS